MPVRALRRLNEDEQVVPEKRVEKQRMPVRALRPYIGTALDPVVRRGKTKNARQGIETHRRPLSPALPLCRVEKQRMPVRALRPLVYCDIP